jgi:hypothetical protein
VNEQVRQALRELVTEHGAAIAGDAGRCEALLRERCPSNKRQVVLLLGVLRSSVMGELLHTADAATAPGRVGMLSRRIEDELAVKADAARWAVESWALALGWPIEVAKPAVPAAPARVSVPAPAPAPAAAPPAPVAAPEPVPPPVPPAPEPLPAPVAVPEPEPVPVFATAPAGAPRRSSGPWLAVAAVAAAVALYVLWQLLRR